MKMRRVMYRRLSKGAEASSSSRLGLTERLINQDFRRLDNLRYVFRGALHVASRRPETMKIDPGYASLPACQSSITVLVIEDWQAGSDAYPGFFRGALHVASRRPETMKTHHAVKNLFVT